MKVTVGVGTGEMNLTAFDFLRSQTQDLCLRCKIPLNHTKMTCANMKEVPQSESL